MSGYTQLTQEERYQIYILRKAGYNRTQVGEMLGRSKATPRLTGEVWQHVDARIYFAHSYAIGSMGWMKTPMA